MSGLSDIMLSFSKYLRSFQILLEVFLIISQIFPAFPKFPNDFQFQTRTLSKILRTPRKIFWTLSTFLITFWVNLKILRLLSKICSFRSSTKHFRKNFWIFAYLGLGNILWSKIPSRVSQASLDNFELFQMFCWSFPTFCCFTDLHFSALKFRITALLSTNQRSAFFFRKAIPIKCFVSHRPPPRKVGSVGRIKKKKKKKRIIIISK